MRHAAPLPTLPRGLFLPDLDAPPPAAGAPEAPDLDALLEEARRAGFEAGRRAGEAEGRAAEAALREAETEAALRDALLCLEGAGEAAQVMADANARAMAGMLVSALEALLPGAAARAAPDLLERLVVALGPLNRAPEGATLMVPPALLALAEARYGARGLPVAADPALAPGDARVEWRRGRIFMDLAERQAALREVLRQCNLIDEETPA